MGSMLPYVPLIAKDRIGISATSFAIVLTIQLFITELSKTALGYVADYFKRMKAMMSFLIIINCLFFLSFLAIPTINNPQQTPNPLNYFKDNKNITQINIILLRKSTICDSFFSQRFNLPSKNIYTMMHSIQANDFLKYHPDMVCFGQLNLTEEMFCFELENNMKNDAVELGIKQHFCCSMLSIKPEKFLSQIKLTKKNFFHLYSLNTPSVARESFNSTIPCIASFKDNSRKDLVVDDIKTYQFWLYACIMILSGTCISSTFTLSDTICYESAQKYNRDFGRQRLFSAISWGIFAPLGGLLCDLTNNFYSTWLLMVCLQSITIWNLYKMDLVLPQFSQNLAKDVGIVLKSRTFLAFNTGVFINGVWAGVIWYYLIWFMSTLGASTFLCGLIPYVQCFAGEIPFMFFSGWFIRKMGHFNLVSLSLFAYAVRFLWYSFFHNPWLVLPMEITHGFTYGIFYPAIASFGKLSAKPGTEATTQSILFSTHEGLGAGVGCVLAGIGFDSLGGHSTFFYFSMLAFGSTILSICNTLFRGKCYSDNTETSLPTK
ncbi:major facilitator superfamily domain-containing protein 6-like [Parasteatoda tepidariorum]|uniref:major facilitator superfamily domain-containing protein 6-like n=1 Tax=Parasteatoda tepidariorum TaxID=114398 RepID=UPI0039BC8BA1